MARGARNPVVPRGTKSSGRPAAGRKKADRFDARPPEDDPYRDLRIIEDEQNDPAHDDYIWPEFEDDDEDRV